MKYAITSKGYTLEDDVDKRFGRCEYIVTYEQESRAMVILPNPFRENDEGVGLMLVDLVHSKGVEKIVSGSFGIKIKSLLDSKRIQMIIPNRPGITVGDIIATIQRRNNQEKYPDSL
jgi:predicted Fe-Mo cluster-binding NifX family protein